MLKEPPKNSREKTKNLLLTLQDKICSVFEGLLSISIWTSSISLKSSSTFLASCTILSLWEFANDGNDNVTITLGVVTLTFLIQANSITFFCDPALELFVKQNSHLLLWSLNF